MHYVKLIVSVDVYIPIIRLVLSARFRYWSESNESVIDSLLFWATCLPWSGSDASWKGEDPSHILFDQGEADRVSQVQLDRSAGRYYS